MQMDPEEPQLAAVQAIASVSAAPAELINQVLSSGKADQALVARRLLDSMDVIATSTGWSRTELPLLLGCDHPDPESWLHVDIAVLRNSMEIVQLIVQSIEEAGFSNPARYYVAQNSVHLTVAVLARVRGDVTLARSVLIDIGPGPTPLGFVAHGRPGMARHEAWRRIRAAELGRKHPCLERVVPIARRDLELLIGSVDPSAWGPLESATDCRFESDEWSGDRLRQFAAQIREHASSRPHRDA